MMDRRTFIHRAVATLPAVGVATAFPALSMGSGRSPHASSSEKSNGDETEIPDLLGQFGKGLPHDHEGRISAVAYTALCEAIEEKSFDRMEAVPLGGRRHLVNPLGGFEANGPGGPPEELVCPPPPSVGSRELATQLAELYWMSRCRDIPFDHYPEAEIIAAGIEDLAVVPGIDSPAGHGLFRGFTGGDLPGPYLSQFFLLNIGFGAQEITQTYRVCPPRSDYLIEQGESLRNLRGFAPKGVSLFRSTPSYLRTGRDLAECVHRDFSYQIMVNAALILLGGNYTQKARRFPYAPSNPYPGSQTQSGFCTFGGPDVLDMVSRATTLAMKAAWYQKWAVHRYLRPEECAARLEGARSEKLPSVVHPSIWDYCVMDWLMTQQGNVLLSQCYPEGCPLHPSYPSAHAAVAGAGATVLKAFFDGSADFPRPMQVVGERLVPLDGALKVGEELDKLASNVAVGRQFAGIHWRCDSHAGLRLGETVAIGLLRNLKASRIEPGGEMAFPSFDGDPIRI